MGNCTRLRPYDSKADQRYGLRTREPRLGHADDRRPLVQRLVMMGTQWFCRIVRLAVPVQKEQAGHAHALSLLSAQVL